MSDNQSENSIYWHQQQKILTPPVIFEITGFELFEADGGGQVEIRVGIISDEGEAFNWVQESMAYRRMQSFKQVIVVHRTLESLKSYQLEELKQRALSKLTLEERKALGL